MEFISEGFETLVNFLGWGDPNPTLLFIGVEEAEPFKDYEEVIKVRNKKIIPVNEETAKCRRYSIPIAKISVQLSREYAKYGEYYKYCIEKLFREGSGVANINLFPLGKKALNKSVFEEYKNKQNLFGRIIAYEEIYKAYIRTKRFPVIREFVYNSKNIKAVICYGKEYWEDFVLVLQLYDSDRYVLPPTSSLDMLLFQPRGNEPLVILTLHFSSRRFSDNIVEEIVKQLKEYNIELP